MSRGHLWVLDGRTGALHQVATPGMAPLDPAFSPDGRWLAFLASSPSASEYAVWLASGDGSSAHKIANSGGLVGWSPAADILAVTAGDSIRLVRSAGFSRTLLHARGISSAAWSPDGSSVAVSVSSVSAGTLASYPLSGGQPTVWLRLPARGGMNYVIDLAGWWRPLGIGFWAGGNCASCNADGDPFYIILMPGSRPRLRGTTLADPSLDQVAAASNGRLAIVAETRGPGMGGRLIWQDRAVKVCGPAAAACTAVALPASDVTLDPAWSPNGTQLAFVRAPFRASAGFPQKVVAAWYGAHQLWLYQQPGRPIRKLNANGASVPIWSPNGNSLIYVARDDIWLLPRLNGQPVRIAGPLYPPASWPAFYGQVKWASQFAWWPGKQVA